MEDEKFDSGQVIGYANLVITDAGREAWGSIAAVMYSRMRNRMEEAARAVGVAPGALRALLLLDPEQGIAMGELAERWGCDASYMTSLADELERASLVRREPKPTDRRAKLLVPTPAGLEARDRARSVFMEPIPELEALDAEEQILLRDLFGKLAAALPEPLLAALPAMSPSSTTGAR
jgi:DNA-binding MarR family transcriptional regulator